MFMCWNHQWTLPLIYKEAQKKHRSWLFGKQLMHYTTQMASQCKRMCPMGKWRSFCANPWVLWTLYYTLNNRPWKLCNYFLATSSTIVEMNNKENDFWRYKHLSPYNQHIPLICFHPFSSSAQCATTNMWILLAKWNLLTIIVLVLL
jgi:hypothetical protein